MKTASRWTASILALGLLCPSGALAAGETGAPPARRACHRGKFTAIGAGSGLAIGLGLAAGPKLWGDDSGGQAAFLMIGVLTGLGALIGLEVDQKRCENIDQAVERERERLRMTVAAAATSPAPRPSSR